MRTNKHHMIPRSKGGADSGINIRHLPIDKHLDWHAVFSNKTPLQQLEKVLELNFRIRTDPFRQEMMAMLKKYEGGLAYRDETIKHKVKLKENFQI